MHLKSKTFQQIPSCAHGFFGSSMSLKHDSPFSFSSAPENNRSLRIEAVYAQLKLSRVPFVRLKQVHGKLVRVVTREWLGCFPHMFGQEGDGLVTGLKNVALGVASADCAPLLWAAPKKGFVGACHAGWRGAVGGILEAMHKAFLDLGVCTEDLYVALGPAISHKNYEVQEDFYKRVVALEATYKNFFVEKERGLFFDLPRFVVKKLNKLGVWRVDNLGVDTFGGLFCSRRRFLKNKEKEKHGVNLSLIFTKK